MLSGEPLRGYIQKYLEHTSLLLRLRLSEYKKINFRRKLNARIVELESSYEQAKSKAAKFEKDKNKLTIDIRDISIQLDEVGGI